MISRRKHMRIVAELGEAYRWERDEAQRKQAQAEAKLKSVMDGLAEASLHHGLDFASPFTHRYMVSLDIHPALAFAPRDEIERLAQRLTETLLGYKFNGDPRPDMRAEALGWSRSPITATWGPNDVPAA